MLCCRESRTEDEEACSPVSPLIHTPAGVEDLNSILMASILESKGGQPTSWKVLPLHRLPFLCSTSSLFKSYFVAASAVAPQQANCLSARH